MNSSTPKINPNTGKIWNNIYNKLQILAIKTTEKVYFLKSYVLNFFSI